MRIPKPFGRNPDESESPRAAPGEDPLDPPPEGEERAEPERAESSEPAAPESSRDEPEPAKPESAGAEPESPERRPEPAPTEARENGDEAGEREDQPTEKAAPSAEETAESPSSTVAAASASDRGNGDGEAGRSAEKPKEKSGGHGTLHPGEFTAPSVGPHTTFDKRPPEERLDFDKISDVDAMGHDKRRTVVGGTYGPTRTRVFATFATFFAFVAALVFGFYLLAQELDAPPASNPDEAPWSQADAPQIPPRQIQ